MADTLNKMPHNWTDEQLVQWAMGEVTPGSGIEEEKVAKEAAKRMEVTYTSVNEVKEEILASVVETEDVQEDDQVEVVETVTEAPTEAPTEKPTEAPTQAPKVKTPTKVDANAQVKQMLEEYLTKMAPGRSHVGNEGVQLQTRLYRTIQTIMRMPAKDFTQAYSDLLNIVDEHRKEHFHERYVYRYFDQLKLAINERKNFERILNLIIATCNPSTRSKTIKQVDLPKTMEGFGEEANQKMTAFYHKV